MPIAPNRYSFLPLSVLCCYIFSLATVPLRAEDDSLFTQQVWPVLDRYCISCHGPEKKKGALRLDTREFMLAGGESGPAIVPGKPRESLLVKLVHHEDSDRTMPPKSKLTEAQLRALEAWISAGAKWAKLPEKAVVPIASGERIGNAWNDTRNPIVKIFHGERLDLWSVKPLKKVSTPAAEHPIDALIKAKAAPQPEVSRRALLRRVSFDLTGLPPTPEEMQSFLADNSPRAYENAIERLLASPRYGEHWARLWLDTVRYSDSNGFDWDEYRPQAWLYRDYVIRSLNQDKPYDRFVREQLAGDELVPGEPRDATEQDALIATTYLRLGPWDNSAAQFGEQDRVRQQWMNDLVDTTGAAFLGTAMSCCRCHDHKSDPLSQDDYYRMMAFFQPLQFREDIPLNLPDELAALRAHNERVEQNRSAEQLARGEILAEIKNRIRADKLKTLKPDEIELLNKREDLTDAKSKEALKNLDKRIDVSDDEAKKAASPDEKKLLEARDAVIGALKKQVKPLATAMLAGDGKARETRVLYQGNLADPKQAVPPGYFSILDPNPASPGKSLREGSTGLRSALADWIVNPENPLTARVWVNRVWQAYFGTGLVATANDFGLAGARPVHPELLDWLAAEFTRKGWSQKELHRLILTSRTYKQAVRSGSAPLGKELRRLSAEQLRDTMLSVCGKLEQSTGGAPVWPPLPAEILNSNPVFLDGDNEAKTKHWYTSAAEKLNVRSIYLIQKRSVRVPFLETFDLPENSQSCARRNVSTVAPQSLTLLNNTFAIDCARTFAARLEKEAGDSRAQIQRAFDLALQRSPTADELKSCLTFREKRSLTELCRVLLNLNEFVYLE